MFEKNDKSDKLKKQSLFNDNVKVVIKEAVSRIIQILRLFSGSFQEPESRVRERERERERQRTIKRARTRER